MSRERVSEKIISLHFVCWRNQKSVVFFGAFYGLLWSRARDDAFYHSIISSVNNHTIHINSRALHEFIRRTFGRWCAFRYTKLISTTYKSSFYVILPPNFFLLLALFSSSYCSVLHFDFHTNKLSFHFGSVCTELSLLMNQFIVTIGLVQFFSAVALCHRHYYQLCLWQPGKSTIFFVLSSSVFFSNNHKVQSLNVRDLFSISCNWSHQSESYISLD